MKRAAGQSHKLRVWIIRKAQARNGQSCIVKYSEGVPQFATQRIAKSGRDTNGYAIGYTAMARRLWT